MSFFGKPETARELARGYRLLVWIVRLFVWLHLVESDWAADFIDGLSENLLKMPSRIMEGTEMTEREMFERSFQRPANYFKLPEHEQWAIDRKLGILDWEGGNLTDEERARFKAHYV